MGMVLFKKNYLVKFKKKGSKVSKIFPCSLGIQKLTTLGLRILMIHWVGEAHERLQSADYNKTW